MVLVARATLGRHAPNPISALTTVSLALLVKQSVDLDSCQPIVPDRRDPRLDAVAVPEIAVEPINSVLSV